MELKIGSVLDAIIKERRLTHKEIAKATGIAASTIGEWVTNRAPRDPVQLKKVAEFLGVSVHFLLFGEEDNQEPLTKIMREDFFKGSFEITVKRLKIPGEKE